MTQVTGQPAAGHDLGPIIDPKSQLGQELMVWLEDMAILADIKKKLKALAGAIKNHGNVLEEVIQVFALYQDEQAGQIRTLADVDNFESTLRAKFSAAQADWNKMIDGQVNDGDGPVDMNGMRPISDTKDAAALVKEIKQIEAFIKYEKIEHSEGKKTILDGASLENLQTSIDSIKSAFGKDCWGHASKMGAKAALWAMDVSIWGKVAPEMKNIQDSFQTLNQSVSQFGSSTNAKLQFVEKQYQQGMGEMNSAMQAYMKMLMTMIRHFANS